MEYYVVGIGDILWDCFPDVLKIGGAPANFAYYAKQFGFESLMISAIGKDSLGAEAKEVLDKEFPELAKQITLHIPDENSRRVGQSVAAASLPQIL